MRTLQIQDVNLAFGEREILKNISFTMDERTRAALAGANGSGKSTILKIITGVLKLLWGRIRYRQMEDAAQFLSAEDGVSFGVYTRSGVGATFSDITFSTDNSAVDAYLAENIPVEE